MKRLGSALRSAFRAVGRFFKAVFVACADFWIYKVSVFLSWIGHLLTHNFILRIEHTSVRLFHFVRIPVTRKRREAFYGLLFVFLWVVGYLVFTLYPMFYSLYLSFHEAYYNLQEGVVTTYIGFQNYLNIFSDQTLLPLFATYLGKMVLAVPLIIVFSILIAVLVNNPIKMKGLWRTIFFLPVVIASGPVIADLTAQDATSLPSLQDSAILTYITENLGQWIADPLTSILTSMLQILWYAGIPILIFLAGLQKVDTSIYEAASIDGASPWDRFWKITLPSISPLIAVNVIYIVVTMSLFVEPGGILDITKTHMLVGAPDSAFFHGYGYAAGIAWVYFLLMVIVIGVFVGLLSIRRKER
jgi:ABC-type sugar transport system permease subunit